MACRLVGAKPLFEPMLELIRLLGTKFSEILIGIQKFSFKKMHSNMSSGKLRPFCLGLNVLKLQYISIDGNGLVTPGNDL